MTTRINPMLTVSKPFAEQRETTQTTSLGYLKAAIAFSAYKRDIQQYGTELHFPCSVPWEEELTSFSLDDGSDKEANWPRLFPVYIAHIAQVHPENISDEIWDWFKTQEKYIQIQDIYRTRIPWTKMIHIDALRKRIIRADFGKKVSLEEGIEILESEAFNTIQHVHAKDAGAAFQIRRINTRRKPTAQCTSTLHAYVVQVDLGFEHPGERYALYAVYDGIPIRLSINLVTDAMLHAEITKLDEYMNRPEAHIISNQIVTDDNGIVDWKELAVMMHYLQKAKDQKRYKSS